jgi:hypothetical protein
MRDCKVNRSLGMVGERVLQVPRFKVTTSIEAGQLLSG